MPYLFGLWAGSSGLWAAAPDPWVVGSHPQTWNVWTGVLGTVAGDHSVFDPKSIQKLTCKLYIHVVPQKGEKTQSSSVHRVILLG